MARLETKSISVDPKKETSTITLYSKFGWTLISSQEIFSRDSHLERQGDDIVSVTETTNYVKLVFQRDKDMPYYNEVAALDNEYHKLLKAEPKEEGLGCLFALGVFLIILGALFLIVTIGTGDTTGAMPTLIALGVGIPTVIFRKIRYSSAKEKYTREHAEWEKKCQAILAEVGKYV